MLTQGTISVLFGCHSVVHSILVTISWKVLYGRWPKLWEAVCILLHDVGHIGLNYLDSYEAKKQHWRGGAYVAYCLFGQKGYDLVAGHCSTSLFPPSNLCYADRYSWTLAPYWWLYLTCIVEPKLRCGMSIRDAIQDFQAQVKRSVESGEYISTHNIYLNRQKERMV